MKLETKFNKEQTVYLIYENRVVRTKVHKIYATYGVFVYGHGDKLRIEYGLDCNREIRFNENQLFASKEELIRSL